MKKILVWALLGMALLGCSKRGEQTPAAPLIAVSILPQKWFVEQIVRDRADVVVLAGPGQNPHTFEPSPKQLAEIAGAAAWVLAGAEFEISLVPKVRSLFRTLSIVDGTAGVTFRPMDPGDEDEEDGIDRHTWLGKEPAKIMAAIIRDTLCTIDKDNAGFYEQNCAVLVAEIETEFAVLREELLPLNGKSAVVYHPAYGYFLDEFNITQEAVETGGKEPSPRVLNALIEKAKHDRPAAIFVQAEFPVQTAQTVADAIGAEVISLDPLAENWLENIRMMGKALKIRE
jgi:zinc transport system substrate-binding protein